MRGKVPDLEGREFGRLRVVARAPDRYGCSFWSCSCSCGEILVVRGAKLLSGWTKSCGCLQREIAAETQFVHGRSGTPEWKIWNGIRSRCSNRREPGFKNYGGRGIRICERWLSFENFFADMGPRPSPKHSIERKENDGDYEPGNCVWATAKEQANNTRANRFIEFGGERLTLSQWSVRTGLTREAIAARLKRGWTISHALTEPARRVA